MSKFKNLCQIYNQSHSEMSEYLESCVQFAETLMKGLEVYLDAPTKRITYRDRQGEEKTLREALCLKDGVWYFDVALTMCPESAYRLRAAEFARCYYPRQTVLLSFVIKKITVDTFLVGLENYPTQFTVDAKEQNSLTKLYEFVVNVLEAYYKHIFQIILKQNESPKKIEFQHIEIYL